MMDYNKLAKEVHTDNIAKGFYDKEPNKDMTLVLIISELVEMIEADRMGRTVSRAGKVIMNNLLNGNVDDNPVLFKQVFEESIKDTIEDEAADVIIRMLDYIGWKNITIDESKCIADTDTLFFKDNKGEFYEFGKMVKTFISSLADNSLNNYRIPNVLLYIVYYFSEALNIDIWKHVELKRKYNKLRPYKNGKKY